VSILPSLESKLSAASPTKDRFFDTAPLQSKSGNACSSLCVLLEAVREKVAPTPGNKSALNIAAEKVYEEEQEGNPANSGR